MLLQITYFQILGKPLIMWMGILTFLSMFLTVFIAVSNRRGKNWIAFKWHPVFAWVTIGLAIIHAILGLANFF